MSARRLLAAVAALATATLAAPSATAAPEAPSTQTTATYVGTPVGQAQAKAFYDAVMRSARAKQANKKPGITAVTVVYDPSGAPSFASEISQSAQIWNNAVDNVTLVAGSNADFDYYEGNDPRGSYAYTDGHGHGYVFLDYAQNEVYDPLRVTAHETGHILGLPDHYSGPCSELMSGGGPGPSCTNPYPDANESARVDQLWANGLASLAKAS